MSRMIESALTDLPEPDSPTMPSVEPASSEYDRPFTAVTTPSSVRKVVRRFLTSSRGMQVVGLDAGQRENRSKNDERHRGYTRNTLELLFRARPAVCGLN